MAWKEIVGGLGGAVGGFILGKAVETIYPEYFWLPVVAMIVCSALGAYKAHRQGLNLEIPS